MPKIHNNYTDLPIKEKYAIVFSGDADAEDLYGIAEDILNNHPHSYGDLQEGIASHENVTSEVLEILAESNFFKVLRAVGRNRKTTLKVLKDLYFNAEDDDYVRSDIAGNPNIDDELKDAIIDSENDDQLYSLLYNKRLNKLDFFILSRVSSSYIREELAGYTEAPPEVLEEMLKNNNKYSILSNLILNKSTPMEAIKELMANGTSIQKGAVIREIHKRDPIFAKELYNEILSNPDRPEYHDLLRTGYLKGNMYDRALSYVTSINHLRDLIYNDVAIPNAEQIHSLLLKIEEIKKDRNIYPLLVELVKKDNIDSKTISGIVDMGYLDNPRSLDAFYLKELSQVILRNSKTPSETIANIYSKLTSDGAIESLFLELFLENYQTPTEVLDDIFKNYILGGEYSYLLDKLVENPRVSHDIREYKVEQVRLSKSKKLKSVKDRGLIPEIDYHGGKKLKSKYNADLELLRRLKGYLNNA